MQCAHEFLPMMHKVVRKDTILKFPFYRTLSDGLKTYFQFPSYHPGTEPLVHVVQTKFNDSGYR